MGGTYAHLVVIRAELIEPSSDYLCFTHFTSIALASLFHPRLLTKFLP